jgi:hypothetical protein
MGFSLAGRSPSTTSASHQLTSASIPPDGSLGRTPRPARRAFGGARRRTRAPSLRDSRPMLVDQPSPDPPGRMTLLARRPPVSLKRLVDQRPVRPNRRRRTARRSLGRRRDRRPQGLAHRLLVHPVFFRQRTQRQPASLRSPGSARTDPGWFMGRPEVASALTSAGALVTVPSPPDGWSRNLADELDLVAACPIAGQRGHLWPRVSRSAWPGGLGSTGVRMRRPRRSLPLQAGCRVRSDS